MYSPVPSSVTQHFFFFEVWSHAGIFIVHSFLLLSSISSHGLTAVCLSFQILMNIWVVSRFWLLTNKAFINFHVQVFVWIYVSAFFGKDLEVELLDHAINVCLTL